VVSTLLVSIFKVITLAALIGEEKKLLKNPSSNTEIFQNANFHFAKCMY